MACNGEIVDMRRPALQCGLSAVSAASATSTRPSDQAGM